MSKSNPARHVNRSAHLAWVPLNRMKIAPLAQREKLDLARVEKIAREFDPDKFDAPKVNRRSGDFWVIDGWHRTEGAKLALGDDQEVQCWVRDDLTDAEAAEWSLGLNDYRQWSAFDKYRMAVVAGRDRECDIDRIVRAQGLLVARDQVSGAISCVGALIWAYDRVGGVALGRSLRLIRDAYGDAGFRSVVIRGLALLCQRFNGDLDDTEAIQKLSKVHGGLNGLENKARSLHTSAGFALQQCIAAAAVEIINASRGRGKKLPSWFKS